MRLDDTTDRAVGDTDDDTDAIEPRHTGNAPEDSEPVAKLEKASYESNADVQRWLREHAVEGSTKPEFSPTFLAHQRDRFWVLSSLGHFYEEDLIIDVLSAVKSGKEATVYCCVAHPSTGAEYLAAKVYRPRMFRALRNDAVYRENRPLRDERGRELSARRRKREAERGGEYGRAARIASWLAYEFETQRLLHAAGADVPRPVSQIGNALLMEYVGVDEEAAPLLREVDLPREEAPRLFERVIRNIEIFLACGRVHGDLSAYNILYLDGEVSIIDFAQAVDARSPGDVYPLLARDIERVCRYFARYGVEADAEELAADVWSRYLFGEL